MVSSGSYVLLGIPTCLSSSILFEWVGFMGAARLDSAMCTSGERSILLDLLCSEGCISGDLLSTDDSTMFLWANKRDIKASRIYCGGRHNDRMVKEYLNRNAQHVKFLNLCDGHSLDNYFPNLSYLICSLTDQTCLLLSKAPNLEELELFATLDTSEYPLLPTITLPRLRKISIFVHKYCNPANTTKLLTLVSMLNFVQELHLHGQDLRVDIPTLAFLAQQSPALQKLLLSGVLVETGSIVDFIRLLRNVSCFAMIGNRLITDNGVRDIVQNLPHLDSLTLSQNKLLTDQSLLHIGQHAHKLRTLHINCPLITEQGLLDLWVRCPHLRREVGR